MALLEVHNLSIGVKNNSGFLTAVNNVSFEIKKGEITGLAGESGCGKTLTALSIMGLLPQTIKIRQGEIIFRPDTPPYTAGENILLNTLGEKELCRIRGKEISMIFQEARQSLNPLVRAGIQITETLELHGIDCKKERRALALQMLEKLGFSDSKKIFNAYPHELSGGMCQRIMIAIAAICRPKLLIADEPTTALDDKNQEHILNLLAEINRNFGTAIFFISHDLSVIQKFCNRVVVMYAGKIAEEGPIDKLFSTPFHPYTKGLLGAIPKKEHRGKPLANIPGKIPSILDKFDGCPFAPRCPDVFAPCTSAFPPTTDMGGGHKVSCFLAGALTQPPKAGKDV